MSLYALGFVAAALIGTWVIERHRLPAGVALSTTFREVDPYNYDKAMAYARRFEEERTKWKPKIWDLEAATWMFEKHARELQMRLPNDMSKEHRLDQEIQQALWTLEDHIQAARKRHPEETLNFPMPLGDYFEGSTTQKSSK